MGLADVFSSEDRMDVKFSDFYRLVLKSTKAELLYNAIKCDVPHRYIRETVTGECEGKNPADDLARSMVEAMIKAATDAFASRMDHAAEDAPENAAEDAETDTNKEE